MHHHLLLLHNNLYPQTPPLPIIQRCFYSFNHNKHNPEIFSFSSVNSHGRTLDHHGIKTRTRRNEKWCVSAAMERESKFEVDPEKARQALNELDQQLETLSRKQVNPPKIRASSLNSNLKEQMKDENIEISGSFLAFTAFSLFAFSIFYNVLFLTVIKPSIDGP